LVTENDQEISVMPKFRVEALEKFIVRTVYMAEAADPQQAEARCKAGEVAYDKSFIEEGDEEWLKTVSVERDG
jgi:hypothetical protein